MKQKSISDFNFILIVFHTFLKKYYIKTSFNYNTMCICEAEIKRNESSRGSTIKSNISKLCAIKRNYILFIVGILK